MGKQKQKQKHTENPARIDLRRLSFQNPTVFANRHSLDIGDYQFLTGT